MNDFTASNGIIVGFIGSSQLWTVDPLGSEGAYANLSDAQMQALREFFQAEADERLGRWRWAENPDYVVYLRENGSVTVFEESMPTAALTFWKNLGATGTSSGKYMAAARAYFDAHPEPKPWHDAVEGEVWILMFRNSSHAWFVNGDYFQSTKTLTNISKIDEGIIAGRRIFPDEVTS